MKITAIVLTKNEEKNIFNCLSSLDFCSEIIVIDDYSSDKTVQLAEKEGAKILRRKLNKDFSQQRNFALSKTSNDWVLFIDADERVSDELANEILSLDVTANNAFYIPRKDFMWGKEIMHGDAGKTKLIRFGRRGSGVWEGKVHETWVIKKNVGSFTNVVKHYPHQSVVEFIREINFYSTLRAEELHKNGTKSNVLTVFFYTKAKFLQNYLIKLGFLDGDEGFVSALIMSFYSFLVRAKLWMLIHES